MKPSHLLIGALLAACALPALATNSANTVRTEAERDQANLTARGNYPVLKSATGKTRAEVVAELEAARQGRPAPAASGKALPGKPFDASLYNGA